MAAGFLRQCYLICNNVYEFFKGNNSTWVGCGVRFGTIKIQIIRCTAERRFLYRFTDIEVNRDPLWPTLMQTARVKG